MKREDYVSQSELAEWRDEHCPLNCPLFGMTDFIPVVDHDHQTGRIRDVLSNEANAMLGKIENFYKTRGANAKYSLPSVLRRMADYLEQDQGPLHPVGTRQLTKRFNRMKKEEQIAILKKHGAGGLAVVSCKNSKDRTKLYRSLIVR
jgi:hypothetical protein